MLLSTSTVLDMENVTAMELVLVNVDGVMLIVDAEPVKVPLLSALAVDNANVMDHANANLDLLTPTHVFQSVIAPPLAHLPTKNNVLDTELADVVPACVILNGPPFLIALAKMAVTRLVDLTKSVTVKENANVFLDSMEKTVMLNLNVMLKLIASPVLKLKTVLGALKKAFVKTSLNLNSALMMNS